MAKPKVSFAEWVDEFRRKLKAELPKELAETLPEDFQEAELKVVYDTGGTPDDVLKTTLPLIAVMLLAFPLTTLMCDCENCQPKAGKKPRRRVRLDVGQDQDGEDSFAA